MKKYWISYEYCDRTKGESGVRSRTSNTDDPLRELKKNRKIRIMATGLSYDTAVHYLTLTPEICRLTAAVDLIFGQFNDIGFMTSNSHFKYDDIIHWLFEAYDRILSDREGRQKYHLVPTNDYLDKIVDAYAGDTGKYLIFRKMKTLFEINPDGSIVDLKEAVLSIGKELMSAALDDQIAEWEKEKLESKAN